ncbi:polygalacturonase-like [Elaeis guineensis]|uniref:polygalacturonase-like n=1 Tax=Elaeis guineensis var. tenera TaxID=51953 RepID=UPI003C6D7BFC
MAAYYCGQKVFDVMQYGAMADGKTGSTQMDFPLDRLICPFDSAFSDAWKVACEFNELASLAIPQETFFLGPVIFRGPCYNNVSLSVQIQETLKAPSSLNNFTSVDWLEFSHLDKLVVDGGGILNGQGAEAWNLTTCPG